MRAASLILMFVFILLGCTENPHLLKLSSDGSIAQSVFLTHDHHENPVVVWTEKTGDDLDLLFAISKDDGKSLSQKVKVPLSASVATHAEGMPKVAFKSDGSIIAAYEKKTPTKDNKYAGSVYYIMSSDEGRTWSEETFLHSDTVSGRSRSYFDIERLPDGEIGASWLDIKIDSVTGGRSVRFARTSEGKGFGDELLVESSACQCCRIDVYADDSQNVFVAYRGLKKGQIGKQIRDMMIATSTDHGKTFSAPVLISADNWNIDGCPHTGPSLCSNKSGLISLWYTEGSGTGIYAAQRAGNDGAFSPRELVSSNGRHPQLVANQNRIAMLWEENIDNNGERRTVIYFRIVQDGAEQKNHLLTPLEHNAFSPVVTKTKSSFLSAFLMERNGVVGVYLTAL